MAQPTSNPRAAYTATTGGRQAPSAGSPGGMPVVAPEFQRNRVVLLPKKPFVMQNGRLALRKGRNFMVRTDDGRQVDVQLARGFLTDPPGLKMGIRVLVPAKNVPGFLAVPMLLPLGLAIVGGLIGGLVGGAGVGLNTVLAKASMPNAAKVLMMLLVAGVAGALWFLLAATVLSAMA